MNRTFLHLAGLGAWAAAATLAHAQLTIPSDGTDRDFEPTQSIEVDLSNAIKGNWNDPVAPGDAGRGIYDPNQRAVVFKYRRVTIPAGVTVSFKNHRTRSPVVWLVQENVTIIGPGNSVSAMPAIDLRGKDSFVLGSVEGIQLSEPGPGGFRGGAYTSGGVHSAGLGWGGGIVGGRSSPGSYNSVYGNPQLLPLIGGSGAGTHEWAGTGAGGGGAILIASRNSVRLDGLISADGGSVGGSRYGAGGAVRIVATEMSGVGRIQALGSSPGGDQYAGRIRIEAQSVAPSIVTVPAAISEVPPQAPVIWPPPTAPQCRIISVGAAAAPPDPSANLTNDADIRIRNNNSVEIIAETTNFPTSGQVWIRAAPKSGYSEVIRADFVQGGTNAKSTWKVVRTFPSGFTTLQARAIVP